MKREPINILGFVADLFSTMPSNAQLSTISGAGNRIGPGRRSLAALHRRIRDAETRDTPGAERMRAVVARRRADWARS